MRLKKQVIGFVTLAMFSLIAKADFDYSSQIWAPNTPDQTAVLIQLETLRQDKVDGLLNPSNSNSNASPLAGENASTSPLGGTTTIGNYNVFNSNIDVTGNNDTTVAASHSGQGNFGDQSAQGTTINGSVSGNGNANQHN